MKKKALTKKENLFCFYCAGGRDARTAAAMAGFKARPQRAAAGLLQRVEISDRIKSLAKQNTRGLEEVCAGYRRLAFGSVADALRLIYAGEDLAEEDFESLDLLNVAGIKKPKGGGLEIKFFDRLKALEKLGAGGEHETGAKQLFDAISNSARAVNDRENGN